MTELKKILIENNYSIYTSNGYYSFDNGIKPILSKMKEDPYFFKDLIVVDKVIGKASAMLVFLSKVKKIHALLLSEDGKKVLEDHQIEYSYDKLVEHILNNNMDGICPMEDCVKDIDNLQDAFIALKEKVAILMQNKTLDKQ